MVPKIADETDLRILDVLVENARISNIDLADRVNLSPAPCLRRVRRMEEEGVIRGYTARIDPAAHGWAMSALVIVRLSRQHEDEIIMFEDAVRSWDEVMECYLVTGTPDYILKVMSSDLGQYEKFIKEKIGRLKCVASIETSFIMNVIKDGRT